MACRAVSLFEKQTESEGAYCTQKMNVRIVFITSLQIHWAEVIFMAVEK